MRHPLTPPGTVNVAAMVVAIAGIIIEIASGVDYPDIPPGPIMLGVAAALVVLLNQVWTQVVAVVVPLFLTVGNLLAPVGRENLTDASGGTLIGAWLLLAGVVAALAAGVVVLTARRTHWKVT